jgi:hypothetical protein
VGLKYPKDQPQVHNLVNSQSVVASLIVAILCLLRACSLLAGLVQTSGSLSYLRPLVAYSGEVFSLQTRSQTYVPDLCSNKPAVFVLCRPASRPCNTSTTWFIFAAWMWEVLVSVTFFKPYLKNTRVPSVPQMPTVS